MQLSVGTNEVREVCKNDVQTEWEKCEEQETDKKHNEIQSRRC